MGFAWFVVVLLAVELLPLLCINLIFVDVVAHAVFYLILQITGASFRKRGNHDVFRPAATSIAPTFSGEGAPLVKSRQYCMWLVNHRSWADFYIDHILTGYQATYLSRILVLAGIPILGIVGYLLDWVWFFRIASFRKKGSKQLDIDKYNNHLDKKFRATPWNGLIVYPEASRNLNRDYVPLRTGMIKYAYSRGIPVQIIIATNKEKVFSETKFTATWGVELTVQYSRVIHPQQFDSDSKFIRTIQREWDRIWSGLYPEEVEAEFNEDEKAVEEGTRRRRRTGRRDSGYERQINEDEGEGEDEDSTTTSKTPERTSEEDDDEEIRSDKQLQEKEAMTETETEDVEEGESEDVQHQREVEEEEEGDNRIDPNWRPPYVEKPGMRLTWIQVRFALLMFLMYSIIITGICLTVLAANDVS